ncbi:DNA gyrase, A subunit [Lactobacillus equicursoris DSM 19284 = JCM 14600 = CIP 110162]|uniref:DNA gyrase subunit A n=1 Tax=Lactobacillus equicursoris DSM 19284 = JCM 14600 = CIP 110162 TaxID=1293597 RepID=K0NYF7_9LACO|nr:DNA gyrase subunit A [Lactobacillus equicursoris]KRL02291.1 dna gyrase subunit a [Lactobacillus equicursoris DSM 19284 = JCM 14600 = CIP 110162]CCK84760.1 DNA gyrase, A subunit [Lactobacillus equicursoris DSM 19284 = JCM 14600 = CIP 110162]
MDNQGQDRRIRNVDLTQTMRSSFLDYAMSVIVARALPDVRDGLKPVQRRILYGMNELGVTPDKPYKKSARIVGDVMGKYHPHGDSSIYLSMAHMAQDFAYRYMLVDGHGNFGSVDGDRPAAMRYTEARMSRIAVEMLRDINKNTIDWQRNYDDTENEPTVLPARIPNLLVNGSSGIAVGMTTNIPPHNLTEVISGIHMLMKDPDVTTRELMKAIPGPDFPTGGILMGRSGVLHAYETGKGNIVVRAKTEIETEKSGRERIVVTEIPYLVNKAELVQKIAELARDKVIDGITGIRDESDQSGMRITIDVRRDASASVVLNNLFKETQMQSNFAMNMVAIVDGAPKFLTLKEMLQHYLAHQEDVITRRTKFDLDKAEARAHILEGLRIALDHIDEIVNLIRNSESSDIAKAGLISRFKLDDRQAQAILDMRLVRLTGLERDKVEAEYQDLLVKIADYKDILAKPERIDQIIYDELLDIQKRFGDKRRTQITASEVVTLEDEDLIEEQKVLLTLTHQGYIKRMLIDDFKTQNRGGRGIKGMGVQKGDFIEHLLYSSTHDYLLFFTNKGKVYMKKAYEIPEFGRNAKGLPIVNLLQLEKGEHIQTMVNVPKSDNDEDGYAFFITKLGTVKKTKLSEFENIRTNGLIALTLKDGDELSNVLATDGSQNIFIATHQGYAVTFNEKDVRSMGRSAAGVRGINLRDGDYVVGSGVLKAEDEVLTISEKGYGKRTPATEYPVKGRGGKGIQTAKIGQKNGPLAGVAVVDGKSDIMLITTDGIMIRFKTSDVSQTGRSTMGVRLIKVDEGNSVASLAVVPAEEEDNAADTENSETEAENTENSKNSED